MRIIFSSEARLETADSKIDREFFPVETHQPLGGIESLAAKRRTVSKTTHPVDAIGRQDHYQRRRRFNENGDD